MHWLRLIVFAGIPMLLALAGPALLVLAWSSASPMQPALLVAILMLATAITVHLIGRFIEPAGDDEALWRELGSLRRQMEALRAELGRLRATMQAGASHPARNGNEDETTGSAPPDPGPGGAGASSRPAMTAGARTETVDETPLGLQLYMEPVLDLGTREIVMYRALPSLPAGSGRVYLGWHALARAAQLGHGGAVQVATLSRCLAFLRELRDRGTALPVICPLEVFNLEDGSSAHHLATLLRQAPAETAQLLCALRLETLNDGSRHVGRELFRLARHGATFVPECASMPPTIPAWAQTLPIRHMDIAAAALARAGAQGAQQLAELAGRGLILMTHGVDSPQLLDMAHALIPLARGRQLAPPRRVRESCAETANVMAAAQ